jgi:hypothetical protein
MNSSINSNIKSNQTCRSIVNNYNQLNHLYLVYSQFVVEQVLNDYLLNKKFLLDNQK